MNVDRTLNGLVSTRGAVAVVLSLSLVALPGAASGQGTVCVAPCPVPIFLPNAAPVPFGPGELASYEVDVGFAGGGKGSLSVLPIDTIHGMPTFHVRMELEGRAMLVYHMEDRFDSWMDAEMLFARRFEQKQDETGFDRHRVLDFFPDEMKWRKLEPKDLTQIIDTGELASPLPLDDISFVFYARTLPLEIGTSYSLNRYWKDEGNPVVINVLRRDTIQVPAGTFPTIVVQPIIQTSRMFGEGGEAEIHFSDDEFRRVVYLKADIPVLSSLTMKLKSFTPGTPVVPIPPTEPARGSGLRSPRPSP
jgi:hypothetical protein